MAKQPAFLEDYAAFVLALFSLYQSDHQLKWYQTGMDLLDAMIEHFSDPKGGFFDANRNQSDLLVRPKELQDHATPSGNSLATMALIQAAALDGRDDLIQKAVDCLAISASSAMLYPTSYGYHLCAVNLLVNGVQQVALIHKQNDTSDLDRFEGVIWGQFRPNLLLATTTYPPQVGSPELVMQRPLLNGKTTAYVCANFSCKLPVTTPEALSAQLNLPFDSL